MLQVHNTTCSHLMQVPLESRSSLFLVSDILAGVSPYRPFISLSLGSKRSYVAGSCSTVRVSLTLADLVNTVTDFVERATQVIVTFLL